MHEKTSIHGDLGLFEASIVLNTRVFLCFLIVKSPFDCTIELCGQMMGQNIWHFGITGLI